MSLIYCVEDEENIRELLSCTLSSFGHETMVFDTAEPMLKKARVTAPDLVLMDVMMPGMDGISALTMMKADHGLKSIPVIMLTAKTQEVDKVRGLDLGADDYITKPFSILELNSRIKAVLRRSAGDPTRDTYSFKDICLNVDKHTLEKDGIEIPVTLKEFDLFKLLLKHKNQVVKREQILGSVWGYDYMGETRTLDMHIKTLRKKLGDTAENPAYIKTIRGIGYTLVE